MKLNEVKEIKDQKVTAKIDANGPEDNMYALFKNGVRVAWIKFRTSGQGEIPVMWCKVEGKTIQADEAAWVKIATAARSLGVPESFVKLFIKSKGFMSFYFADAKTREEAVSYYKKVAKKAGVVFE